MSISYAEILENQAFPRTHQADQERIEQLSMQVALLLDMADAKRALRVADLHPRPLPGRTG